MRNSTSNASKKIQPAPKSHERFWLLLAVAGLTISIAASTLSGLGASAALDDGGFGIKSVSDEGQYTATAGRLNAAELPDQEEAQPAPGIGQIRVLECRVENGRADVFWLMPQNIARYHSGDPVSTEMLLVEGGRESDLSNDGWIGDTSEWSDNIVSLALDGKDMSVKWRVLVGPGGSDYTSRWANASVSADGRCSIG
jgi:hypothetical protein